MAHYLDETLMDCGCNFFNKQKKKIIIKDLWKKTISKDVCLVNIDSVWVLRY